MDGYFVKQISYQATKWWILHLHYAKRMPMISFAYGLFHYGTLVGICTFGSPASPFLCKGICGEKYRKQVIELNRLALLHNIKNEASFFISRTFKLLPSPKIIVSYADTHQKHIGYVYQATNWLYTGATKQRTDIAPKSGKHSRHHLGDPSKRVIRWSKHRYVFFIGSKKERRILLENLKYPIVKYAKQSEI